jgi:hypothetical protein
MKIQGAVIREQGVSFAIVVVKKHIVDSPSESNKSIQSFSRFFPRMPIVLMGQGPTGQAKYRGRQDLVNFLSRLHISQIPWKEYTFS